jgi:hypothetical protein
VFVGHHTQRLHALRELRDAAERLARVLLPPACQMLPLPVFLSVLIPNLVWGLIKPVSTLALKFRPLELPQHWLRHLQTLRINNKTQPPHLGRVAGPAYTVNLYPNPAAPLTPLYPKSPVREFGGWQQSHLAPRRRRHGRGEHLRVRGHRRRLLPPHPSRISVGSNVTNEEGYIG